MKEFAEQLADCLMRKSDIDAEISAIVDAAKDAGVNTRALKRVAKELATDSAKLAKKLDDERQLEMFRVEVGLFKRKGLDETTKAEAAFNLANEKKIERSARELDAVAGTNIAGSYADDRAKIRKWRARRESEA